MYIYILRQISTILEVVYNPSNIQNRPGYIQYNAIAIYTSIDCFYIHLMYTCNTHHINVCVLVTKNYINKYMCTKQESTYLLEYKMKVL